MYKTQSFSAQEFKPSRFESAHSMVIRGEKVSYRTVSEDNVFYDAEGKPIASLYSYTYLRTDAENAKSRPVVFGYNGGPGSSAIFVHAGFLGTRRMKFEKTERGSSLPPYEVIDNTDSILDVADIVLVDPVGTGYGVLLDESHQNEFYGLKQDAETLLIFIERWLTKYDRWLSPKYLLGESYGCTRNAVAAGLSVLGTDHGNFGVRFDGIVMIGNTVTVGRYFREGLPVEASVIWFPTLAAIHWYHNRPTDADLETFVYQAKEFADTDYLLALYRGESLQGQERADVLAKIMYYTGMNEEYLEPWALKIDPVSLRQEVIKHKGRCVSRNDGRMTRKRYIPEAVEESKGAWDDAIDDQYMGFFQAALLGDIHPYLNICLDRQFAALSRNGRSWDYDESSGTTAQLLQQAMMRTLGLRVFFANGWLDGSTEVGHVFYTIDHGGLPKDRVCFKGYESGHMIYVGEKNCRDLSDDVRSFLQGGMPGRTFE